MKILHKLVRQFDSHHACLCDNLIQLIWRQNRALSLWSAFDFESLHYGGMPEGVLKFDPLHDLQARKISCCMEASEEPVT
jgi:hypothetical protein